MELTIITAVSYNSKKHYVYKRALELIEYFKNKKYQLIITDSSKNKYLISKYQNIKIIQLKYQSIFSPAITRNEAIKSASNKYIMFYDVDMSVGYNFFDKLEEKIIKKLERKNNNFILLPFIYLTKEGTKVFEKNKNIQEIKDDFLKGNNKLVKNISLNSSAMVIKKTYLEHIGLFDTDFIGHGGEDFELIHRLIANNPHSKKPNDYYINETSNIVANLKGFRRYMAYYTLPLLFEDLFLIHRWHNWPIFSKFYMLKNNNHEILINKMKSYDLLNKNKLWNSNRTAIKYNKYIINLCKQYKITNYEGLFKEKNIILKKNNFKQYIRKILFFYLVQRKTK
ncbi:glycosyltransferase [Campylobacter sp. RM12637]|uniref:glycosyltransferase n=1 Tax=Campylobacter sp. RM12637 TaxID=2735734 RepID=UPI003014A194|nr:glycosyltransferase [Campylobacter sp. RM12637]